MRLTVNPTSAPSARDMAEAMRQAPQMLLHHLAEAYQQMGKLDIEQLRSEQLSGGRFINARAKTTRQAFTAKATDPERVTRFEQLFVDEYSRWPAAALFEKGGTIKPRRGQMWIVTAAARGSSGRRRWSDAEMKGFIQSGKWRVIKIDGRLAVLDPKKRVSGIMAWIVPQVKVADRLDWQELIQKNMPRNEALIEAAIGRTIEQINTRG